MDSGSAEEDLSHFWDAPSQPTRPLINESPPEPDPLPIISAPPAAPPQSSSFDDFLPSGGIDDGPSISSQTVTSVPTPSHDSAPLVSSSATNSISDQFRRSLRLSPPEPPSRSLPPRSRSPEEPRPPATDTVPPPASYDSNRRYLSSRTDRQRTPIVFDEDGFGRPEAEVASSRRSSGGGFRERTYRSTPAPPPAPAPTPRQRDDDLDVDDFFGPPSSSSSSSFHRNPTPRRVRFADEVDRQPSFRSSSSSPRSYDYDSSPMSTSTTTRTNSWSRPLPRSSYDEYGLRGRIHGVERRQSDVRRREMRSRRRLRDAEDVDSEEDGFMAASEDSFDSASDSDSGYFRASDGFHPRGRREGPRVVPQRRRGMRDYGNLDFYDRTRRQEKQRQRLTLLFSVIVILLLILIVMVAVKWS